MTKFLNKFKKPCFWPIFGPFFSIFEAKKISGKHTSSYEFLAPCQNLAKADDTISRKRPDSQDGRMDRSYFIGPF